MLLLAKHNIATVGFQVRRITEPLIRERADKVYLITHSEADKAAKECIDRSVDDYTDIATSSSPSLPPPSSDEK
jgi:hypothetical protein